MIKEFFSKIRDGFYNWCDRAGDWFVGKHDVPVVGGILLWFGDKLKKSYKYYKDMNFIGNIVYLNEEPYAAAIGGEITKDTFGIQVAKMIMPVGRMNEVWRAYVDER